MILFAFHAIGDGTLFHRELVRRGSRCLRVADATIEQAFAPLRIMHECRGRRRVLPLAGNALFLPVAERLFG